MVKIKINRKIRDGLIIAISVIAVAIAAIFYSVFADRHIFNESAAHLGEIYDQIKTAFSEKVDTNRSLLNSWQKQLDDLVTDINGGGDGDASRGEMEDFIATQKALWGFSDFYFIGDEAPIENADESEKFYQTFLNCKKLDGDPLVIHVRRNFDDVLKEDQCVVIGYMENDESESSFFMMFAVAVPENVYDGFGYRAIGIRYDSDNLSGILDISTFGTQGHCYVVLPDGNIILELAHNDGYSNLFDYLKTSHTDLSADGLAQIKKDWNAEQQKTGARLIVIDGTEYYFTYRPIGYVDWVLVGVAPSARVNSSMNWFRTVTIIVMVLIFAVACAAIIVTVVLNNKRRVKETLLEMRSRENLLDLLSLNTNDIFVMFSPDTFKAEYVSANLETVLGVDKHIVEDDIRAVFTNAEDADTSAFTASALKALPDGYVWDKAVKIKNVGTEEKYWFRMALYHLTDGYSGKCVLTLSDRTEDKKMREQLEEALELAKQANEAKSNFLSNMSHDIRTPLNAIIGYATLLARDADNAVRVRDYTRKITYSGQHLLSLINDILDMSKIESGKTSLFIEQFSLPEFVEELYAMVNAQAAAKKLAFDVHTKGNIPEYVLGDKMRLTQILLNILSNAVKYTEYGGTVSFRVETMKQTVHNHVHLAFIVEDNGIGMSSEYVKTIFEPFSREVNAKTKNIHGTGLGMAITKNIVDLMGGVITVESELGVGSTFTVELELALAENLQEDGDFWERHNVTRVLVVDDEEDVCMDIKELMADTGVCVNYVLNGADALKEVERAIVVKEDYNIVILDWKMPDMDGVETARRIRQKVGRSIPIMVLTSYSFEDIEDEAREAGIDLFLSKPFFVSNFRRAVAQISSDGKHTDISPPPTPEQLSLNGLHILAAEDNEINVEILTELLEIEGATCDIAFNGKEAVEKFQSSKPGQYDIIFMDVQMPIMDGYEATRAIRACKHKCAKTVPILAMTANAFDDDVKAAIESGMNAHLAKPINMDKLKEIVAKLLNKQ